MDRPLFFTSSIMFSFSLVAVGLRLYSRNLTNAGLGWDDGFIMVAAVLVVALFGLSIQLWDSGYDRDSLYDLGYDNHTILVLLLVFKIIYMVSMCLAKLGALSLYARIFIQKRFRLFCQFVGVLMVLIYIAMLVEAILFSYIACTGCDMSISENPDNGRAANIRISASNLLGNVVILIIPLPSIWKLQMKIKTKISLTILFCLGLCVAVVSCVRLSLVLHENYNIDTLIAYGSRDMHLHVLEPELAIFSLCLPVLHPLWLKLHEKLGGLKDQLQDRDRVGNVTSVAERDNGDGNIIHWKQAVARVGHSHYDVRVEGGTPEPITTARLGRTSPYMQRFKPKCSRNPYLQGKPPQLAQITVNKSWTVSYEAASVMH
ncbi:hypothetical protein F4804DRAFT_343851 [Jackrogersella minutella]|nr:hypothetical protein F4804DRAFT_343851 [Jackrogersella minutella]